MKFNVDADLLSSAIRANQRLAGAEILSLEIRETDNNFIHVYGIGPSNVSRFSVPIKVETKSKNRTFSVQPDALINAVNKRKGVSIEVTDGIITVTSSRYKATLITSQLEHQEVVPKDVRKGAQGKMTALDDKFGNVLAETLPKLDLKPLLSVYDSLPIGIKATDKGTFVAAFDNYQSAFFFDKALKGDFEIQLPSNLFLALSREVKDQKYKISITENALYAWNENFELSAVLASSDDQIQLSQMLELYKAVKKDDTSHKLVFQTQGVRNLIENSKAIYEKDSVFEFTADKDKIKLELRSSLGTMATVIKIDEGPKKQFQFSCDFGFFSQLLQKAPESLTLYVNERMLMFNNAPVTYILSLV